MRETGTVMESVRSTCEVSAIFTSRGSSGAAGMLARALARFRGNGRSPALAAALAHPAGGVHKSAPMVDSPPPPAPGLSERAGAWGVGRGRHRDRGARPAPLAVAPGGRAAGC